MWENPIDEMQIQIINSVSKSYIEIGHMLHASFMQLLPPPILND